MTIWLLGAFGGAGALALGYWLIVVAEGAYFGPWAVRVVYRFGAPHYDAIRAATINADPYTLRPILLDACSHVVEPRVLDVATGTGRVPLLLCAAAGFRGTVDALDLTAEMLDQARAKQQATNPAAPIRWQRGEACRLPWAAAVFDLVTCLEALEYFPHPRLALAEMARVLRPGGSLVASKVPDVWARLLPRRALTSATMEAELHRLGLIDVEITVWQPGHYELVTARKPAAPEPPIISYG
jgi:ubiquinone/menaquinone biosynthesis C-methylase UbiE